MYDSGINLQDIFKPTETIYDIPILSNTELTQKFIDTKDVAEFITFSLYRLWYSKELIYNPQIPDFALFKKPIRCGKPAYTEYIPPLGTERWFCDLIARIHYRTLSITCTNDFYGSIIYGQNETFSK
jgi:hypothetical protein